MRAGEYRRLALKGFLPLPVKNLMDSKSLAEKLGITQKTVLTRAKALGIKGTTAKIEGQNGRPSAIYSPEECDRIANYGKSQNPTHDGVLGDDDAAEVAGLSLRSAVAAPLTAQFSSIASQLDSIEESASNALAARVASMPSRILTRTAKKLKGLDCVDLSEVFGVLTTPSLPMTTIDINLGSPLPRQ